MYFWQRDDDEALESDCPICRVGPGSWCVYVGNVVRAGTETKRLHIQRRHELWLKRPILGPKKHRLTAAVVSLQAFDRAEEQALRTWLRQYVHILLELDSPSR
jgi:hypothetical protein